MGSRSNRQAGLIPSIIDPTNQQYTGIPGYRHQRRRPQAKSKDDGPYVPDHGPGGGAMKHKASQKKPGLFKEKYLKGKG